MQSKGDAKLIGYEDEKFLDFILWAMEHTNIFYSREMEW